MNYKRKWLEGASGLRVWMWISRRFPIIQTQVLVRLTEQKWLETRARWRSSIIYRIAEKFRSSAEPLGENRQRLLFMNDLIESEPANSLECANG